MYEQRWEYAPPELQHDTLVRAYELADFDMDEAEWENTGAHCARRCFF